MDEWLSLRKVCMAILCVYCLGTVLGFFCVDESLFWAYLNKGQCHKIFDFWFFS
jgi:hypothetical protein